MKKKNVAISLISGVLVILIAGRLYLKLSKPKFEDLDPSWGMGTKVTEAASNDRDYYWYVDQWTTGKLGSINCAPTVFQMVSKWQNKESDVRAENIRNKYQPVGAGFDLSQFYSWTTDYNIKSTWVKNVTEESLKAEIDNGNIVVVMLNLDYIKYNENKEERVGKYFDGGGLHYVIIKGYKVVDKNLYFEIYDPASGLQSYKDLQPIGINRYYEPKQLIDAIWGYFPDVIVVENLD
ncbi:MAG: C39 family peptidase [Clostridium sp.]|uniref:C39 family peptidase n=1 Tax=Clostridium sp. TaxID=1506 RepID=UPI00306A717A